MPLNREIKFRGKRLSDGEWCYGYVFHWRKYGKNKIMIGEGVQNGSVYGCEVDPKTVHQFTELHDKNKREIYDGDIGRTDTGTILIVMWLDDLYGYYMKTSLHTKEAYDFREYMMVEFEVIGNIIDTPKLLSQA